MLNDSCYKYDKEKERLPAEISLIREVIYHLLPRLCCYTIQIKAPAHKCAGALICMVIYFLIMLGLQNLYKLPFSGSLLRRKLAIRNGRLLKRIF